MSIFVQRTKILYAMRKVLLQIAAVAIPIMVLGGPLDFYVSPINMPVAPDTEGVTKFLVGMAESATSVEYVYTYDSELRPQYLYMLEQNGSKVDSIKVNAYTWYDNGLCASEESFENPRNGYPFIRTYKYDQYSRLTERVYKTITGIETNLYEYDEYGNTTKHVYIRDQTSLGGNIGGNREDRTYSSPETGELSLAVSYDLNGEEWVPAAKHAYQTTKEGNITTQKTESYNPGSTADEWTLSSYSVSVCQVIGDQKFTLSQTRYSTDANGQTKESVTCTGEISGYTSEYSPFTYTYTRTYGTTKDVYKYNWYINDEKEHLLLCESRISEHKQRGFKESEEITEYYPNGVIKKNTNITYSTYGVDINSMSVTEFNELGLAICRERYSDSDILTSRTVNEYYENSRAITSSTYYSIVDNQLVETSKQTCTYDYTVPSEKVIPFTILNKFEVSYMLLEESYEYFQNPDLNNTITYKYADISDLSGVEDIVADTPESSIPEQYFDLWGRKIASPTSPGVYIRRQGSTTTKVIRR